MKSLMNLLIVAGTVAIILCIGVFKAQGWIDSDFATVALASVGFGGAGFVAGNAAGKRPPVDPPPGGG